MSEQKKVKCCDCGKTLAFEDETTIYIKCSGKKDGHKCGKVNEIKK